ncbi:hypothetical protein SAMN06265355_118133 [Actinomadura mexicana]|uniref:Uncharacterized protein n=1 Tax=Actinomadura mexicana TaxID=134959 RepID=A0A239EX72_9ACTN|nr:hypothetical protein SAMN06265355_118133 [Actinomadura mexicana]
MGTRRCLGRELINRTRAIVERHTLRCRTRIGHNTALRYLEGLAVVLEASGWRCVRLYRPDGFPISLPVLRVYAPGAEDVEVWVHVRAEPDDRWSYYEARQGHGTGGHIHLCGDAKGAAEHVEHRLRARMYLC